MRKFFLAVAAMVMLATSCTKDETAPMGNESLVSFSVSSPELQTRVEDGKGLSTNHLQFAFYDENGEILTALTGEVKKFVGSTTINIPLVEGRIYSAIFWADNEDAPYQVNLAGKTMTITEDEFDGNADKYDAFYKYEVNIDPKKKVHKIELTRPFAQINIATADKAAAANAGFNAVATQVTVRAHSTLNLATGVVGDNDYVDYTYTWATLPTSPATATVGSKSYDMLAMNYVLVNERELVNVTMEASEEEVSETATYADAITRNYTTVPVQRNYRTYIVGNLLTTPNDFNVETKPGFNDTTLPDTDLEQFIMDIQTVGGEFTLTSDITLKEALVVRKDVVLDLAGHTITGPAEARDAANNKIHVIVNEGTLTIKGGVISSVAENGGSAIMNKGTLTVENATLNGAPNAGSSWPSYAVNNTGKMTVTNTTITSYHGAVASYDEGVVTLNNSTIDMAGIPGFTNHGIYTYNGGKVVVNGGTYANKATDQNATGASVINGNVEVNAGTFSGRIENYYGTPVLKGGSYSVKPNANFVATDYKVIEKDGKWHVVPTDVDAIIMVTPANIGTTTFDADNALYKFEGAFTNATFTAAAGKTQVFDAATATFNGPIKFTAHRIAGNANELTTAKSGNYTLKGFVTRNSISVGSCAIEALNIEDCEAYMMYLNISNSNVKLSNNTIVRPETANDTYVRYDGNSTQKDIIQVYAENYNLQLVGNTIKDEKGVGNNIEIYGEHGWQQNNPTWENSVSATDNVFGNVNNEMPLVKIYNDVTFAPVAWPADYEITDAAAALAKQLKEKNTLNGGSCVVDVLCRRASGPDANIKLYGTADDKWPNGWYEENNVYYIVNAKGLSHFSGATIPSHITEIKLLDHIDMQNAEFAGMANANTTFNLVFNGNDKTISNIKLKTANHFGMGTAVGLFDTIAIRFANSSFECKDLTLSNVSFVDEANAKWAGGVIGYAQTNTKEDQIKLTNIHVVTSEFKGLSSIGGLIGMLATPSSLYAKNCSVASTTIKATEKRAGAFVGMTNAPADVTPIVFENCTVASDVTITAPEGTDNVYVGQNINNSVVTIK